MTQHDFTETIFGGDEPAEEPIRRRSDVRERRRRPPRRQQPPLAGAPARGPPRRWGAASPPTACCRPWCRGCSPSPVARTSPVPVRARSTSSSSRGDRRGHRDHAARRRRRQDPHRLPRGRGRRPEAGRRIQPGTYALLKGMRAQDAFDTLADPANRVVQRTTIREGLWKAETFAALSKSTGVPVEGLREGRQGRQGDRAPRRGRRRRRGLALPVHLRVRGQGHRRPSSSRPWSPRPSECSRRPASSARTGSAP